jgi:hypothetical protein
MSNEPETKVCPKCAESIKAKARLCPYCRSSQKGIGVWRDHLLGGAIVLIWATAAGLVTILVFFPWVAGGHQFWQHHSDLKVYGIRMEPVDRNNPPYSKVVMSGFVTNVGVCAWRIDELEVRLMDANGRLLDVEHVAPYPEDCVVGPGQVGGFEALLYNLAYTNDDLVRFVRVNKASDANHWNWVN